MYTDGEAYGSDYDIVDAEKYPVPAFDDVKDDLPSLLGYFVAWDRPIDVERIPQILQFNSADVIDYLDHLVRGTANTGIEVTAYSLCVVIGTPAADWIRSRWNPDDPSTANALCIASAKCLPGGEGLRLAFGYMDTLAPRDQAERAASLSCFHDSEVLDWIESHLDLPMNKSQWGQLTSFSRLDWIRTNRWLNQGRPLSLIAIEALMHIYDAHTRRWSKPPPELLMPAPAETMIDRLNQYAKQDAVPNVKRKIELICRGIRRANG